MMIMKFEVFLPGHIIIGSNGGGELYGIDNKGNYFNVPVLIDEDDVAVLSHDFDDQLFAAQITQLIQVFQFKNDDSFQTRLGNGDDTRILDMLSKQHTEIRRGHGAWFIVARQIDERQGSACRETETLLTVFAFNRAEQLVRFRLGDFGQRPSMRLSCKSFTIFAMVMPSNAMKIPLFFAYQ